MTIRINRTAEAERKRAEANALVVGGCHVGRDLAARLVDMGVAVRLVDETWPTDPPDELDVHETASIGPTALDEAGLTEGMSVVAANPADSTNLLLGQIARTRFGVDRVLARVNDPRRIAAFETLDIETVDASAELGHAVARRW